MMSEKHPMEVVNTSVALPSPGTNNADGSGNGTRPRLDFYTWGMLYHLDTTMAELEPASSFLRAREQLREVAAQMDLDSVDSETDDTDVLMFRSRRSRGRPRQTPPATATASATTAATAPAAAAASAPAPAQRDTPRLPAKPAQVASVKVYRSARQISTTTATSESPVSTHTESLSRLEMAMADREDDWRRIQIGNSGYSISIWVIALLAIMGLLLLVGAIVIAFWLLAK